MKKIMDALDIKIIQEYIAYSIIQSLCIGSVVVLIILVIEYLASKLSNPVFHKIYKYALISLIVFTLFGKVIIQEANFFDLSLLSNYKISYDLIYWINIFWFTGAFLYSIKIVVAQHYIKVIVSQSKNNFPEKWKLLLLKTKEKIQYFSNINLVHSDRITSAFVTGVVKPILVFPFSWINNLTEEEAEFILVHELSHLKAKDQYVNIICYLSEIIFFYNPAVHFIIKRIRFQREVCADQMVISQVPKPFEYASLLIRMGENPNLNSSIAFSPIKNQLNVRVKNILQLNHNKNRTIQHFIFPIFLGLLSLSVLNNLPDHIHPNLVQQALIKSETNSISINQEFACEKTKLLARHQKNKVDRIKPKAKILMDDNSGNFKLEISALNEFQRQNLIEDESITSVIEPIQMMRDVDSSDTKSLVIIIKPNEYGTSATNIGNLIRDHTYYFEKDWNYRSTIQPKMYKYIIVKDIHNNILSYSINLQSLNQISTIN